MSEPKFCKDCKHYTADQGHPRCGAPAARIKTTGEPGFATVERTYSLASTCGPEAKWFIPAPPVSKSWWEFWK